MSATANRADALFMAAMIPPAIPAPDAYLCSSVFICGLLFLSVFISVHLLPALLIRVHQCVSVARSSDPCSSVFICGLLFLSVFVGVHLWPAFLYPCSSVFICGLYLWLSTRFEHYRGTAT